MLPHRQVAPDLVIRCKHNNINHIWVACMEDWAVRHLTRGYSRKRSSLGIEARMADGTVKHLNLGYLRKQTSWGVALQMADRQVSVRDLQLDMWPLRNR